MTLAPGRTVGVAATSLLLGIVAAAVLYSLPRPVGSLPSGTPVVVWPTAVTAPRAARALALFEGRANKVCAALNPAINRNLSAWSAARTDAGRGRAYAGFVRAYRRRARVEQHLKVPEAVGRDWRRFVQNQLAAAPLLASAAVAMREGDRPRLVTLVTAAEKHTSPARAWALAQGLEQCS